MTEKLRRSRWPWSLKNSATAVALAALPLEAYWCIYHSHRYNGSSSQASVLLFTLPLILLHLMWVEPLFRPKFLKLLCGLLSLGLSVAGIFTVIHIRDQRLTQERAQHGVSGYGRVIDFELEHRRNGTNTYAVFEYQHQAQTYRQRVPTAPTTHLNEILRLYFASTDPENVVVTAFDVKNTSNN